MDNLTAAMRALLIELALTSNGTTARFDSSSSGGYYTDSIPRLGQHDAPHLYYAREWAAADSDERRTEVLEDARRELDTIRRGPGGEAHAGEWDEIEELYDRIVAECEGMTIRAAADWARCSSRMVRAARRRAHREEHLGRKIINGRELTTAERRAKVQELDEAGTPARQIAKGLGVSYSTVLRDLGQKG